MSLSALYLDAFYACAQAGHFTKASERLNITQSALSQRIKNLEQELTTTLFIRDRAGIRLTEAGYTLLRYCQSKSSIEAEVIEQIRGDQKSVGLQGHIRIGGFSSVMRSVILPSLAPIIEKNPGLRLSFSSEELADLPGLLKQGEIDYMILDHELRRDDLVMEPLGTESNVMVKKKNADVPEIYLDHDESDQTTIQFLKLNKLKYKIERRYLDDVYGIIDGVKMGLGKAVLPTHLIQDDKQLVVMNNHKALLIPVVLHYYKQDYYSKLHHAVVEVIKKNSSTYLVG